MEPINTAELFPEPVRVEAYEHPKPLAKPSDDKRPDAVGCILPVFFKAHEKPASGGFKSFMAQTFPHKKLAVVIKNGLKSPAEGIEGVEHISFDDEIDPVAAVAIATSRWEQTDVKWLCWWPPYAWSHPDRLMYQMACKRPGAAVCLREVVQYHMTRSLARIKAAPHGFLHTAIWPKWMQLGKTPLFAYPKPRENSEFMGVGPPFPQDWIPYIDFWGPYCGLSEASFTPEGLEGGGEDIWILPPSRQDLLRRILIDLEFPRFKNPGTEAQGCNPPNQGRFEHYASSSSAP